MREVFIASDHAGFELKAKLLEALKDDAELIDLGPHQYDKDDDYPDFAAAVVEKVLESGGMGILVCDTGLGMSVAANRYAGIRAALCANEFMAERARTHNDANVLCLGSSVISDDENIAIAKVFLAIEFSDAPRHIRRNEQVDTLG